MNNYFVDILTSNEIKYFGLMNKEKSLSLNSNTYMFESGGKHYCIDPGIGKRRASDINSYCIENNITDLYVLLTHYHYDHLANITRLDMNLKEILFSYLSKPYFEECMQFQMNTLRTMVKSMDITMILKKYIKTNKTIAKVLEFLLKLMPDFMTWLIIKTSFKYTVPSEWAQMNIRYLNKNDIKDFTYGDMTFQGWEVNENIIALKVLGHTGDSISYYIVDKKCLLIGDLDSFLNPRDMKGTTISTFHESLDKIIEFIKNQDIQLLGSGHYVPIHGNSEIINYLQDYQEKNLQLYYILRNIILEKNIWAWPELWKEIKKYVSLQPDSILQYLIDIDFPKTPSFLDIYLYLLLTELNYECHKNVWTKRK